METAGDYPHNGLGGLAVSPDGSVYVGVGENLGLPYTLIGTDATRIAIPAGAGGRIFKCRPDGAGLTEVAIGFWNPFGLAFDSADRLLAVDNDPDSRPPCRLLHVIQGGDYGFQFRHGRDGLSPFIAWDGELPGTLPMAAGTGEGPTSVVPLAHTGWARTSPMGLLVAASWDHALELYDPTQVGRSFKAERHEIVTGGEDFRPVALAVAPDGSIVFTDWVKQDYNVHSHGRLWRLSSGRTPPHFDKADAEIVRGSEELNRFAGGNSGLSRGRLKIMAGAADPFVRSAATSAMATRPVGELTAWIQEAKTPLETQHALLSLRRALARRDTNGVSPGFKLTEILSAALANPDPGVRLVALQWVAEDRLNDLRAAVTASLHAGPATPLLLAAQAETLRRLVVDGAAPAAYKGTTVRIIPQAPVDPEVIAEAVRQLDSPAETPVRRRAALRVLAGRHEPAVVAALRRVASNLADNPGLRAAAVVGLTGGHEDHVSDFLTLLKDPSPAVALEEARALRPWLAKPGVKAALESVTNPPALAAAAAFALGRSTHRPTDEAGWLAVASRGTGDAESGRRVFESSWAACSKCHRIEGSGGAVGPDLSTVGRASKREKLVASLFQPSRDIAPQYAQYLVETRDGESYSGRVLGTDADGSLTLVTGEGQAVYLPKSQIAEQRILTLSMMPDGLLDGLSVEDFADLIAFLESRR
jgi:putative heme-binding domain-containing protein